mmetsp:Transcript_11954/g.6009  ORF Transcript_11954/g.6009 Transcript_11954/m.6009 type:complete len:178 (+) Transcript_11954:539-1072(+)
MAGWKLAPTIAAGCCSVLKPASFTPTSILVMMELIQHLLPPGVINVVTGPGEEVGRALGESGRVAKLALTGDTSTGTAVMGYASKQLIPVTLELGGKSPNIFLKDVMDHDDQFLEKAVEGLVSFAFNSGEVCTCPSRALIHEEIYEPFMAKCLEKIASIVQCNPMDTACMMGAQVSV